MIRAFRGKAVKLGDNVPAKEIPSLIASASRRGGGSEDPEGDFRPHGPGRAGRFSSHSILVVGNRFGHGEGERSAVWALKEKGLNCVVAKSFSRAMFRAGTNEGLVLVQSSGAVDAAVDGCDITVDPANGRILLPTRDIRFVPFPRFLLEMIADGGLLANARRRFKDAAPTPSPDGPSGRGQSDPYRS